MGVHQKHSFMLVKLDPNLCPTESKDKILTIQTLNPSEYTHLGQMYARRC